MGQRTRRLRLAVAYDGGPFSGFARQPGRRTVQGELERALSELAGAPVETVCAGRTDAGVHARGQVVHADLPDRLDPGRVRRILNAVAGPAIVVRQAAWAPEGFDARFSARRRTYVYRIDDSGGPDPLTRGYVLAWPRRWSASTISRLSAASGRGARPAAGSAPSASAGCGGWSRSGWSRTPSAGRWHAASSATCSAWATAAATPTAPPGCSPAGTAPRSVTSPRHTVWCWSPSATRASPGKPQKLTGSAGDR